MSRRAVAPVVGVCLMLAVTVVLAALVGAFAIGLGEQTENAPEAAITSHIEKGSSGNPKIVLIHRGGDAIDVRDITVRVFVDGQPLQYQPNVPFYSEKGFDGFPDGPFNSNTANNIWTAGEDASLTIAGTNSPYPSTESHITVKIYASGEIVAATQAIA